MADQENPLTWEGMIGPLGACLVLSQRSELPEGEKTLTITSSPSPSLSLSAGTGESRRLVILDWEEGGFLDKIRDTKSVAVMEPPSEGETDPIFYFAAVFADGPAE